MSINLGKLEKATFRRTRYGKKCGQGVRSLDLLQIMLGLCETENGTKIDELLQARASGHKRVRQDAKTNSDSRRRQGHPPRKQELGRLRNRKEGSQGKETGDCGLSSKREDSWHRKAYGTWLERKMLQDGCALPKEERDIVREYKAMHEENFLSSWLREEVVGSERGKDREQKVREEESRGCERKVEREEEKTVVVKRKVVDRFSCEVLGDLWLLGSSGNSGMTCVVTRVAFRSVPAVFGESACFD